MKTIHTTEARAATRLTAKIAADGPPCPEILIPLHLELASKLDGMPRDLGIVLIVLGVVGIAIPGPIPPGASFVLLGIVFLRPGLVARFAGPLAARCPRVFRLLIGFVDDLRTGLERRYPGAVPC